MELRQRLLKVLLIALVLGAAGGVLVVLTGADEVVWRGAGTALLVSAAAGLALAASRLLDRAQTRTAGVAAMGFLIAEFLLLLALIWNVVEPVLGYRGSEAVGMTAGWLVPVGIVVTGALRLRGISGNRWAADTALAVAGASLLVWEMGTWGYVVGSGWWWDDYWFGTSALLGGYGLFAAAALAGMPTLGIRPWRWIGVVAAALGGVLAISGVWLDAEEPSTLFTAITAVAVVIAHTNLLCLVDLQGAQRAVRVATVVASAVAAAAVSMMVVNDIDGFNIDTLFGRITSAFLILAACGTMATAVLGWLNHRPEEGVEAMEIRQVTLVCPDCQRKSDLPVGNSACPGCRLRFRIRVEEPRCGRCDYLLYGVKADQCPECGEAIGFSTPADDGVPRTATA